MSPFLAGFVFMHTMASTYTFLSSKVNALLMHKGVYVSFQMPGNGIQGLAYFVPLLSSLGVCTTRSGQIDSTSHGDSWGCMPSLGELERPKHGPDESCSMHPELKLLGDIL